MAKLNKSNLSLMRDRRTSTIAERSECNALASINDTSMRSFIRRHTIIGGDGFEENGYMMDDYHMTDAKQESSTKTVRYRDDDENSNRDNVGSLRRTDSRHHDRNYENRKNHDHRQNHRKNHTQSTDSNSRHMQRRISNSANNRTNIRNIGDSGSHKDISRKDSTSSRRQHHHRRGSIDSSAMNSHRVMKREISKTYQPLLLEKSNSHDKTSSNLKTDSVKICNLAKERQISKRKGKTSKFEDDSKMESLDEPKTGLKSDHKVDIKNDTKNDSGSDTKKNSKYPDSSEDPELQQNKNLFRSFSLRAKSWSKSATDTIFDKNNDTEEKPEKHKKIETKKTKTVQIQEHKVKSTFKTNSTNEQQFDCKNAVREMLSCLPFIDEPDDRPPYPSPVATVGLIIITIFFLYF